MFQYLDDARHRRSPTLAERAQMTKQSMGELVRHLEAHGYVERMPDPADGRAKLVRATDRGREVYAIVRDVRRSRPRRPVGEPARATSASERLREDLEAST